VNTLFFKTLLWFIGTAALTIAALVLAAAWSVDRDSRGPGMGRYGRPGPRGFPGEPPPGEPPPGGPPRQAFGAMLNMQMVEAIHAHETGGPEALRETLERFRRVTGNEGVLTDSEGRDLVTGRMRNDLKPLLERGPRPPWITRLLPFIRLLPSAVVRRTLDGRYAYFLLFRHRTFLSWFLQPELHIAILALLTILCWAFARHLTNPVRQLQQAVQQFGQGDLSSRVRSHRKDEMGQLARTFDTMADRMETLLTAERRLLQDVSHELRSPLARMNVAIELARSEGDTQSHLNRVQKEADRLNALVSEMLQVTRAEGDISTMRLQPVRIDELLAEIAADGAIEAEQRGCRVETKGLFECRLQGDPELLRRAFENILRNAIRYSPAGSAVELSMRQREKAVVIAIRDYGPGVPGEALGRIFDSFFRVESDRDRSSGGVGLGLSIARRAVELHHGRIRAANANPGLLVEAEMYPA
jgi:signal transduction histidine kinase